MKISAVIFDMDGIITDTEPMLAKYWCQAANEFGFPMEYKHALELRSLAGEYAAPLLKSYFGDKIDYRAVRNRRKELMEQEIAKNGLKMKKGVKEILDYLDTTEFKRAVATATDLERAERYLKMLGIYDRFSTLCCGPMVKHGKPAPDIYLMAAEQIGIPPSQCIAVEDSPNGIKSAYSAGMHPVMIPDLSRPDEQLKGLLFGQCKDLTELPLILEQVRNNQS